MPWYGLSFSTPNCPCLGCDKRNAECHSQCGDYAEYLIRNDETKRKRCFENFKARCLEKTKRR